MDLQLYDTLTREKRPFTPLDPARVRMYVYGPTVYDFAHIGNARHRPRCSDAPQIRRLWRGCAACRIGLTGTLRLDWRAWYRTIRAEYATVASLRFEPFAATLAVIEKLAGIYRHLLGGTVPAFRASDGRFLDHAGFLRTSAQIVIAMIGRFGAMWDICSWRRPAASGQSRQGSPASQGQGAQWT
jgi:hypothetical protein